MGWIKTAPRVTICILAIIGMLGIFISKTIYTLHKEGIVKIGPLLIVNTGKVNPVLYGYFGEEGYFILNLHNYRVVGNGVVYVGSFSNRNLTIIYNITYDVFLGSNRRCYVVVKENGFSFNCVRKNKEGS